MVDRIGQTANFTGVRREALRTIDRLSRDDVIGEQDAVRLEEHVRRDQVGSEARYINAVSNPDYVSAFGALLCGGPLGRELMNERERAAFREVEDVRRERAMRSMGVATGAAGAFAIPIHLDPSLIRIGVTNQHPAREIGRVVSTQSYLWQGVTSTAVTASFAPELTPMSDNSPTLGQVSIYPERAQAFVPFSWELAGDWTSLSAEIGVLFSEAEDQLESVKFLTGAGHASSEPQGVLIGAGTTVQSSAATAINTADLYTVKAALPQRYQANASWAASGVYYDKIRRLVGPASSTETPIWTDANTAARRPGRCSESPHTNGRPSRRVWRPGRPSASTATGRGSRSSTGSAWRSGSSTACSPQPRPAPSTRPASPARCCSGAARVASSTPARSGGSRSRDLEDFPRSRLACARISPRRGENAGLPSLTSSRASRRSLGGDAQRER